MRKKLAQHGAMKRLLLIFCLIPALLMAQQDPVSNTKATGDLPEYTSTYINDFAGIITPEAAENIQNMLENVRKERGVEMTVVTIRSRHDYGDWNAIEPFATALFNKWGVGNAKRNDGIMILVAWQDRDMRIELGAGYPPIFDDRVKRVIDHHFIPWFRDEKYAEGIEAGVAETIKRTRLEFTDDGYTTSSRLRAEAENALDSTRSGGIFAWIFGAMGLAGGGLGLFGIRRWRRNRPRDCDLCGRKMERLSEQSDDDYLSHGQKVEESLKSTDYDVWYCRHDDHVMIERYKKWFSGFGACPNCDFLTLHSQRTVLTSATTSSTGMARVDYSCRNCQHKYSEKVVIPRKSKSSSSSSSGSFGGGSSSGGGASGSW